MVNLAAVIKRHERGWRAIRRLQQGGHQRGGQERVSHRWALGSPSKREEWEMGLGRGQVLQEYGSGRWGHRIGKRGGDGPHWWTHTDGLIKNRVVDTGSGKHRWTPVDSCGHWNDGSGCQGTWRRWVVLP